MSDVERGQTHEAWDMLGRTTMQIEALRRPFSVEDYDRMVEVVIIGKEDRIELMKARFWR